jgi:sugar/nucleoside kinase (ribokinase family)
MKILLLGHSIIDKIEKGGQLKISPGGIYYSLLGLLSTKSQSDQIYLLTGYNKKYLHLFYNLFSKANLDYSNELDSLPEVMLQLHEDEERIEVYTNLSTELDINKINNWNLFDGILINMITGFDISLDRLKTIRKNYNGVIYFDLHTLSRGVDNNMMRKFRPVPNAGQWISNVDILQCNNMELSTISSGTSREDIIRSILNYGLKYLIVTRGKYGAELYYLENNNVRAITRPASSVNVVNKIGCGDIFGAVFFYNYLCQRDTAYLLDAAVYAAEKAVSMNLLENINLFLHD